MDPIEIARCTRHPQYKGMKPTKRDCDKCHIVYLSRRVHVMAHILGRVQNRLWGYDW